MTSYCLPHATYVTAKSLVVDIIVEENSKTGMVKGWKSDTFGASINGQHIGYLNMSYISVGNMEKFFPNTLTFVMRRRYWERLRPFATIDDSKWTSEQLCIALTETAPSQDQNIALALASKSHAELCTLWRQRRRLVIDTYNKEYREFREFHLCNPLVDYSKVYEAGAYRRKVGAVNDDVSACATGYRGQGVGQALYEAAGIWYHRRGMRLHRSGIQSDEARGFWDALVAKGLTQSYILSTGDSRTYLDVPMLLQQKPWLKDLFQAT